MSGSERPSFSGALAVGRKLDLPLPDSPAVRDAYAQAEAESQPWLFNHVMRSWLYGAKLAQRRGLAPDAELVAVAVLLHDLGLARGGAPDRRFEVVGADIGLAFALTHDMGECRAEAVWDSIALHTIPAIAQHKGADVACGQNGIACDYGLGGHLNTGTTPARVVEWLRADLARGRVEATAEPVETHRRVGRLRRRGEYAPRVHPHLRTAAPIDQARNSDLIFSCPGLFSCASIISRRCRAAPEHYDPATTAAETNSNAVAFADTGYEPRPPDFGYLRAEFRKGRRPSLAKIASTLGASATERARASGTASGQRVARSNPSTSFTD
jgi:hypothetical protein